MALVAVAAQQVSGYSVSWDMGLAPTSTAQSHPGFQTITHSLRLASWQQIATNSFIRHPTRFSAICQKRNLDGVNFIEPTLHNAHLVVGNSSGTAFVD